MEELLLKLNENGLVDEMGYIILEKYSNGEIQVVDKETFKGFFGNTDCSYDQLIAEDKGKGYTMFFDKWKELGIL